MFPLPSILQPENVECLKIILSPENPIIKEKTYLIDKVITIDLKTVLLEKPLDRVIIGLFYIKIKIYF